MLSTAFNAWLNWIGQLWNACFNNMILAIPIFLVLINGVATLFDKIKKMIK